MENIYNKIKKYSGVIYGIFMFIILAVAILSLFFDIAGAIFLMPVCAIMLLVPAIKKYRTEKSDENATDIARYIFMLICGVLLSIDDFIWLIGLLFN
jgi:hypothetical protein